MNIHEKKDQLKRMIVDGVIPDEVLTLGPSLVEALQKIKFDEPFKLSVDIYRDEGGDSATMYLETNRRVGINGIIELKLMSSGEWELIAFHPTYILSAADLIQ